MKNKTCVHCKTEFNPKSGRADYCSPDCRKNENAKQLKQPKPPRFVICKCCGEEFRQSSNAKFCSATCRNLYDKQQIDLMKADITCLHCNANLLDLKSSNNSRMKRKYCNDSCYRAYNADKKYKHFTTDQTGLEFVVCPVCNIRTRQITVSHAKIHGFDSQKAMQLAYPGLEITCQKMKELSQGENNPGYKHGGKLSCWSKKFVHGYDEVQHNKFKQEASKRMKESDTNMFNINYWLKQCDGNEAAAKLAYSKSQTHDLAWFVSKYGEIDGPKRRLAKIEKWSKSFKKCNFSKISQQLFNSIFCKLTDTKNVYYATFARPELEDYKNKEYILSLGNTYVRPDFICLTRKKVIEFDGDYWHSEKRGNIQRDQIRDNAIVNAGYEILHVTERNYNSDPNKVIEECLNFLNK